MFRRALAFVVLLGGLLRPSSAEAWIFPEHTRITAEALAELQNSPTYASKLEHVLSEVNAELGLCRTESEQCVAFADLPSLAGDHSCSPGELSRLLRDKRAGKSDWVFAVLKVASDTRKAIDDAGANADARVEARRQMHLDMQSADPDYVGRAVLDYSHFQIGRETPDMDAPSGLEEYLALAFSTRREANATAAYANYHVAALRLAAAAQADLNNDASLLVRALVTEAFALHFLEDSFSAGHFVGHWGSTPMRLGTHDYYCGAGVEARTWTHPNTSYLAHGDAFLSDDETARAGSAIAKSLAQVLDAATDGRRAKVYLEGVRSGFADEHYDSCAEASVPIGLDALATAAPILAVLADEPMPARRSPETARVLAENGWFFGVTGGTQVGLSGPSSTFGINGLGGLRGGYGAGGLVNDPMNAQAFLEVSGVGYRAYTETRQGDLGVSFRARFPGVIAFDGLFAIPLAEALQSECPFCIDWAAKASSGGLLHLWRSMRIAGPLRWQFALLRDVTVNWFPNRRAHYYRLEVLAPAVAFRIGLPVAGTGSWAQAADFYLDAGPMVNRTSEHTFYWGGFVSLSAAGRLFP